MSGATTFIGIACGWQSMDKGGQAHTPIFYIINNEYAPKWFNKTNKVGLIYH
jgi:hypothetical protein